MSITITRDMTIGRIREVCPRADEVLSRFFGPGCFSCPNSRLKSIEFGASVHGQDVDEVVEELNRLMQEQ
ncbi:hypothetical protein SY88_05420 [Clostridiales bacterium PH28_bin88]|nr:hypothetical protein SY88_05420 [Clostridiales bacterium PH28_bin88]